MSHSLQKHLHTFVRTTLDRYEGAWLVWCDPRGEWSRLLERVASDSRMGGFRLVRADERVLDAPGSLKLRRQLQELLASKTPFVLLVPAAANDLGWLWAHALQAETTYSRSLRDQLVEWGWQPQSLAMRNDEVAALALQNLQSDPATWSGSGLNPDYDLLLQWLVGDDNKPSEEHKIILDLTIEKAGLPPLIHPVEQWRVKVVARLLVTDAHRHAPHLISESHEALIAPDARTHALALLDKWADSLRLRPILARAIEAADPTTGLDRQLADQDATEGPFLSRAAERALFVHTCESLATQNGRALLETLAGLEEALARHANGFWADTSLPGDITLPWGELLRLSRAATTLLHASPSEQWKDPGDAIRWYSEGGWRMDQAGEELLRNLSRVPHELLGLLPHLRAAYRARWEETLLRWSEVWVQAGCPVPDLPTAGAWLAEALREKVPAAILVLDALRYDIGATLAAELNSREGSERATVSSGRAPIPTITVLGMASALPIPEGSLEAEVRSGKWRVEQRQTAMELSTAEQRRRWWQSSIGLPQEALLNLDEMQSKAPPAPSPSLTRLVIHDRTLDRLGHDDELEAQGSGAIQQRYLDAIQRLRDAGWRRIFIVTDHGYLHWSSSTETSVSPPLANPHYLSRRAAAYPANESFTGPQALAPGGAFRVAVPSGAAAFRSYGGLGFFHGGASLQEWIIPCIRIQWPSEAKPVGAELEPLPNVLSQRPTVTVRVVRGTLFIEEALPRRVEIVIRHAEQRTILFRSGPQTLTPDQERLPVSLAIKPGVEATRGTRLLIEVRDGQTEEILSTTESQLKIELTGW